MVQVQQQQMEEIINMVFEVRLHDRVVFLVDNKMEFEQLRWNEQTVQYSEREISPVTALCFQSCDFIYHGWRVY